MEKGIEFVIKKITTEQFAIVEESFSPDKEINLFGGFRFGANSTDKTVSAFSLFRLENDNNPFIVIEVGCHFIISDESWNQFINREQNKVTIDKGFITHLLTITVGVARGVLHAKTEGSRFNQYLLPTLNLSDSVKDNIDIDIVQENQAIV